MNVKLLEFDLAQRISNQPNLLAELVSSQRKRVRRVPDGLPPQSANSGRRLLEQKRVRRLALGGSAVEHRLPRSADSFSWQTFQHYSLRLMTLAQLKSFYS